MEFKQLEAFVAVVDYGSFSEAARKLYLTQPTISAHVRSLEEELHTKLILRTTKKTTITTRGYTRPPAAKLSQRQSILKISSPVINYSLSLFPVYDVYSPPLCLMISPDFSRSASARWMVI